LTAEQKERRRKLRQFALAVADPTSPTFGNNVDSYLFAFALTKEDVEKETIQSVARKAHRARYLPFVTKAIAGIQANLQSAAGLSGAEYVQLLIAREAYYAKRGIPGDAAASARLLQFVGKSLGHLADKPLTDPNDKKPLLSGEEVVLALLDAAERMRRLREANPLPALPSATAEIIVEPEEPK
jgi:hypothetical protein